MPAAHYLLLFPVLGVGLFISSCAGFGEAYNDRVCWNANSAVPFQCSEAFMRLRCPAEIEVRNDQPITAQNKLTIIPVEGYSTPKVGELFSHHGSIPIFIENGSPWLTLHDDVMQILIGLGYEVSTDAVGSETLIKADMTLLDVRSDPGGWLDFKGTTQAVASFKVTMQQNNGEELWSSEFTGEHQIKVSYFLLSDAEETLGQAYCHALENFAHAARTAEFQSNLR